MEISIRICGYLKSALERQTLLPQLSVASEENLEIFGIEDKFSFLSITREDSLFVAKFFIQELATAHIHSGSFDIFITNTYHFISCLITNRTTPFKTKQEHEFSGEKGVSFSDTLLNDFYILKEMITLIIEPLETERETDKHISF